MTYLDYQATTPLAPEAFEAMLPWLKDQHANPHSVHREGRAAMAAVGAARQHVIDLMPRGGSLAFTGGATEALNWAIKGTTGPIVTANTEHAAVLDTVYAEARNGRPITVLPVQPDGLIDLNRAAEVIQPGTGLVAIMLVNNEIGVIQPIDELTALTHAAGALFLCDAVQGYGKVAMPQSPDLIAVSAHKIYGPKGIGALWIREGVKLDPLLNGGGQEPGGRSGTLSPALCAGFGAATKIYEEYFEPEDDHIVDLWNAARGKLGPEWIINGSIEHRFQGNLNIRRKGLDVARLMTDLRDIAFSAGSACASGSGRPSHVLQAIGLSDAEAKSSIRLGFGRYTAVDELVESLARIDAAARAQRIAA